MSTETKEQVEVRAERILEGFEMLGLGDAKARLPYLGGPVPVPGQFHVVISTTSTPFAR